jgi:hypothetical protein
LPGADLSVFIIARLALVVYNCHLVLTERRKYVLFVQLVILVWCSTKQTAAIGGTTFRLMVIFGQRGGKERKTVMDLGVG